jgi:hypothetical protein
MFLKRIHTHIWILKLLRNNTKHINTPHYNVEDFKDNLKKETFRFTLINRYQPLEHLKDNQDISTESHWQQIKKAWTSVCNEVLGKKERYHKGWLKRRQY